MAVQRIGDFSLVNLFQAILRPRLLPLRWHSPGRFTQERFCFSCYRQCNFFHHPLSPFTLPFSLSHTHSLFISHSILIATSTYSFITFGDEGSIFCTRIRRPVQHSFHIFISVHTDLFIYLHDDAISHLVRLCGRAWMCTIAAHATDFMGDCF